MNARLKLACAALSGALMIASPAFAQSTATSDAAAVPVVSGFYVTANHPDISISPGKDATFTINLFNATGAPKRADLSVSGLPDGWTSTLKADSSDVSASMVLPNQTDTLKLAVTPAADAAHQTFDFSVGVKTANGNQSLPLSLTIADIATGTTALVPDLPALKGTSKTTFKFKLKLTNGSADDQLFNLAADTPPGFETTFKRGYGSEEITGVPVKAGATENITLEVKPPAGVDAGSYPVRVATIAGDGADQQSATTDLSLDVTGSPSLRLQGPQQRLSGEGVAGQASTFPFTLENTGSAPAQNLKLSASSPSGWTVSFDPAAIPQLPAGTKQDVTVTIKPTEKAIAGDYMVTLRASADGASESSQFRITVNTSTIWGVVGLGIIAVAVLVLVAAVMRYGRR